MPKMAVVVGVVVIMVLAAEAGVLGLDREGQRSKTPIDEKKKWQYDPDFVREFLLRGKNNHLKDDVKPDDLTEKEDDVHTLTPEEESANSDDYLHEAYFPGRRKRNVYDPSDPVSDSKDDDSNEVQVNVTTSIEDDDDDDNVQGSRGNNRREGEATGYGRGNGGRTSMEYGRRYGGGYGMGYGRVNGMGHGCGPYGCGGHHAFNGRRHHHGRMRGYPSRDRYGDWNPRYSSYYPRSYNRNDYDDDDDDDNFRDQYDNMVNRPDRESPSVTVYRQDNPDDIDDDSNGYGYGYGYGYDNGYDYQHRRHGGRGHHHHSRRHHHHRRPRW